MVTMGIKDITERILKDANQQKQEILAVAGEKAEQIRKEGEKTAEKRKEAILLKANQEATEEHHTLLTMERLEARKLQLTEKQKVIEKAFGRSLDKLINHPDYSVILETLLLETATGGEELILSPEDQKRLGDSFLNKINQKIKGEITLSGETRKISGGFILRTKEMEINESFEEKIRALRDEMEADVARTLFAG
jgi:V/A-type H+-transporting ATPase subunit E